MKPSPTIGEARSRTTARLRQAGLPSAAFEARALIGGVLGLSREEMLAHPDRRLTAAEGARLGRALERRAGGEPLARITGVREFWSLPIGLGADTLVPRPETETVVEAVLELIGDRDRDTVILDLGTGSGCILFALLSELPRARGLGVDLSAGALACAEENAERLGFAGRARFRQGDWGRGLARKFDIVVANPPYIAERERAGLAAEVREFDPDLALFAGVDGLAAYRRLAPDFARLLKPEGIGVVELGAGQAAAVNRIFKESRLFVGVAKRDLAGHERALPVARRGFRVDARKAKKKVGKGAVPV